MPGYRLSFGTMDLRVASLADAIISADQTVGEVVGALPETVEVLGQDYFASISSNQFSIRFAAPDDSVALSAASLALRAVSAPVDGEKIERRRRQYVSV